MLRTLITAWAANKLYDVASDYLGNRSAQGDRSAPAAPSPQSARKSR